MADNNKNLSPSIAAAAAAAAATGDPKPAVAKVVYPDRARVRTVTGGRMIHLHTGMEINGSEKKIDIDAFARLQLDAGKWEIVTD
jgi:hypothetical protein